MYTPINLNVIMFWVGIIVTTLFSVAQTQTYSTDEAEKLLLESIQNNEAYYDVVYNDSDVRPCEPYINEKPDFTGPGRRISEAKCLEYIWDIENRDKEAAWGQKCRIYRLTQTWKGVVPETFSNIQSPLIYRGRPASHKEFAHMGAIGWKSKTDSPKWQFKCSSTLISENFSLTAAHCSRLSLTRAPDVASPTPEIVRFGVDNIADDEFNRTADPLDIKVKRVIPHPKYRAPKKYFDIALIELESVVQFKSNVHPACLWPHHDISQLGTEASLSGWGYNEEGKQATEILAAVVDVIDTQKCDDVLSMFRNRNWQGFKDHQVCAGKLEGGIDTCQGDSGAPLQVKVPLNTKEYIYYILGVTSFGIKCRYANRPGVYTRVSSFIDWIEDTVWGQNTTA